MVRRSSGLKLGKGGGGRTVDTTPIEDGVGPVFWTSGSQHVLKIQKLHLWTMTINQPRKAISTATRAAIAGPLEDNDVSGTSSSESDTLNPLFGFFDRPCDFPVFPTPVLTHRLLWKVTTVVLFLFSLIIAFSPDDLGRARRSFSAPSAAR